MKNAVIMLWVAILILGSLSISVCTAEPWEVLAQSPGAIESATIGTAGEVCILEQLRFIRKVSEEAAAEMRVLPLSERIFLSPSGSVYASIQFDEGQEMPAAAEITLHQISGEILWNLKAHPLNDVCPLDNGGAVAISRNLNVLENEVYFFSSTGELVKTLSLAAVGEIRVSPSGDRIIINSGRDGALLFDAAGNEMAKLSPAYRMSFSLDGRWVAVLYGPKITLYHEGLATYVGEMGGEIVRGASFSPDNSRVAVFTDHALFLLQNPGDRILMQRELTLESQLSYTSVDLTREAGCIAAGLERDLGENVKGPERHPEGQVLLYNADGSICYQMEISYSRWNTTTPRVKFSADGSQLLILTRDQVMKASLQELCGKGGAR